MSREPNDKLRENLQTSVSSGSEELSADQLAAMVKDVDRALSKSSPRRSDPYRIYIKEVQGRQRRLLKLVSFTHSSTKAAGVMLMAAIVALIVANTPAHEPFLEFWHTYVTVGVGSLMGQMSFAHIINDIFMAVFFLLVGLEIKYEMTVGELTNIRQAALPIIAACGGVLAPIVIYLLFNGGNPETVGGWGIPTATDIAFALGILALLGNRVPSGVRVFLSTLAVADDIIAILVIAVFYGQSPSFAWLACAAVVMAVLILMNRSHVYSLVPYILVGGVLWFCIFMSGVHSTIAGVLLAFAIPSGSRVDVRNFFAWSGDRMREAHASYDAAVPVVKQDEYLKAVTRISRVSSQVVPPATRLEHKLYPWVYFGVLPLFALTNADVAFLGGDLAAMATSSVTLGVFFGLVVGKPVGIMLFSFLTVKLRIASLPENVNWLHMLGAAILGGVGFTMAIFVANLAFVDPVLVSEAKLGILMASLVAGVAGFSFLFVQARADERRGVAYLAVGDDADVMQTADAEAARESQELLVGLGVENLPEELAHAAGVAGVRAADRGGTADTAAERAAAGGRLGGGAVGAVGATDEASIGFDANASASPTVSAGDASDIARGGVVREEVVRFLTGFREGVASARETDGNRAAWEADARWGSWAPEGYGAGAGAGESGDGADANAGEGKTIGG